MMYPGKAFADTSSSFHPVPTGFPWFFPWFFRRQLCSGLVHAVLFRRFTVFGFDSHSLLQLQFHLYTPSQRQSGKPGCFCLHRFEVIALTVCPLNGNCIYNHRTDTGVDCCGRSACAYPDLQKQQLAGGIAELLAIIRRTPAQEEKLQRYRRYFRELNNLNERNGR